MLSPLLFCLVEHALSRSISKLVSQGYLDLIRSSINNFVLSHIFYANDILIFYTGKMSNIIFLKKIFQEYSEASGHSFNLENPFIHYGSINDTNPNRIISNTGFSKGSIHFNFLGIPIFKGRTKSIHLSHISNKIMNKLVAWNSSLLSIVERLILVKSIILSMI